MWQLKIVCGLSSRLVYWVCRWSGLRSRRLRWLLPVATDEWCSWPIRSFSTFWISSSTWQPRSWRVTNGQNSRPSSVFMFTRRTFLMILYVQLSSFIHSGYLYSALQETYSEVLSVQLRPKRNVFSSLQKEDTFRGSKRSGRGCSFSSQGL